MAELSEISFAPALRPESDVHQTQKVPLIESSRPVKQAKRGKYGHLRAFEQSDGERFFP